VYIRDRVQAVSSKRSLVRKRSGGEKEIYRGLYESGCSSDYALGGPILRQSILVLLSVTVRVGFSPLPPSLSFSLSLSLFVSSSLAACRRRGVNSYATRCLHYHISDAICCRELMQPRYFAASDLASCR